MKTTTYSIALAAILAFSLAGCNGKCISPNPSQCPVSNDYLKNDTTDENLQFATIEAPVSR